jgi:HK97 gp10 family phage protein
MSGEMDIEFDISNFVAALDRVGQAVAGEAGMNAARAGALVCVANAQINVENNFTQDPTGNMKAGIRVGEVESDGMRSVAMWGVYGVIYARIHEFGGIIQAVNGPYLVFKTLDGAWHSVPSVDMPARPYMRPAMDEHHSDIRGAIEASLVKDLQAAVGGS